MDYIHKDKTRQPVFRLLVLYQMECASGIVPVIINSHRQMGDDNCANRD